MIIASLPLFLFVFAGLFSPGPNVVMLTASGARFGFRATLPHLLGVPIGTGILAAASALGVSAILLASPQLKFSLQVIASIWILWLAWKMALASQAEKQTGQDRPFTFIEAILFQAVNPKVWAITLAASAGFASDLDPQLEALRLFAVFFTINLFVCLFWTSIGHMLSGFLKTERIWRFFMITMSIIMAGTVILIFM